MNRNAILLFFVIACSSAFGKVVVRGKIVGYDGKSTVSYIPTIEGIFAPYWYDIKPAPDGSFRIEYDNKGYGNIKVHYKSMSFRFFHTEDSKIYFEVREVGDRNLKRKIPQEKMFNVFDSLKQANTIKITGDHAAINQFYNRNLRSSYLATNLVHGHYYSQLIFESPTPSAALFTLDSLTQIEIRQVDQMIDIERSDTDIRNFLKNEIYSFYGAIFLNGLYLKRVEHIKAMADSSNRPNIYNRDWELLVEKTKEQFVALRPTPNSPDFVDFVEGMMNALDEYRKYRFPQADKNTLDNWIVTRLINYDTTLLLDPQARFEYELFGMNQFLGNQMMYSPALLHAITSIQKEHAGSAHIKFYQPKIDALKAYLERSMESNIISEDYERFDDLIKRFEGRNVFVDIWATWCAPCIEEFRHKGVVQSLADRHDIAILYISIDKPAWEDRWKKNIAANELQGTHFRADKRFVDNMWETIGGERGVIPRYLLIDKQGKVFNSDAAKPSSGEALISQIKTLIRN